MICNTDNEKISGQLCFLNMLLSIGNGAASGRYVSCSEKGSRRVEFSLTLNMDESLYQLCLDLALQKLITTEKTKGGGSNGKHSSQTIRKKQPGERKKPGETAGGCFLP
ncbi:MAG: hypothetical protein LWY06_05095 [Firmicutes bacterium]|nr:hypothetical protein [Bacillota bacterium]